MNNENTSWRWGMLFLGGSLAFGLVLATHLATRGLMKTKLVEQDISVKGYAERRITSDRATWSASFGAADPQLPAAYVKLRTDLAKVQAYLDQQGIGKDEVSYGPIAIHSIFKKDPQGHDTNELERYWLVQPLAVSSDQVQRVAKLATGAAHLIEEGVELEAQSPCYVYTKLNDLKSNLLADATRNARGRAEQIASNSGAAVGSLRAAHQGVFQITPVYDTEVSDTGVNDTSSLEKMVRAVVTVEFAVR